MRHSSAMLGMAHVLVALTFSTVGAAAGSPAGQATDGPAVKIECVTVFTTTAGGVKAGMITAWETPSGERGELSIDGPLSIILAPNRKKAIYLLDPTTKQAQFISGPSASPQQFLPDRPSQRLMHQRRLAPVDFLGYRCIVREGTQIFNGSLRHVQIWEALVNGKMEQLRLCSQGNDGSTQLVEAVSVHVYPKTPPGLLDVPPGYTITPLNTAKAQKGTPLPISASEVK